ncbi:MAG TPA: hypothetical protein VMU17_04185 [Elusimicrobiota bacterium]|nr:hypothetical protein [Elusimicrobiota bacterium]
MLGIPTFHAGGPVDLRSIRETILEARKLKDPDSPFREFPVEIVIAVNGLGQEKYLQAIRSLQTEMSRPGVPITVLYLPLAGRTPGEQSYGKTNPLNAIRQWAIRQRATVVGIMDDDVKLSPGNIISNVQFLLEQSRNAESPLLTGSTPGVVQSSTFWGRLAPRTAQHVRGTSLFTYVWALPPLPSLPLNDDFYLLLYFDDVDSPNPYWRIRTNPNAFAYNRFAATFWGAVAQDYRWVLADRWVLSFMPAEKFRLVRPASLSNYIGSIQKAPAHQRLNRVRTTVLVFTMRWIIEHAVSTELDLRQWLNKPRETTRWASSVPLETKEPITALPAVFILPGVPWQYALVAAFAWVGFQYLKTMRPFHSRKNVMPGAMRAAA